MMSMTETDPVANNLKRAYREAEPDTVPAGMAELLRRLREADEREQRG